MANGLPGCWLDLCERGTDGVEGSGGGCGDYPLLLWEDDPRGLGSDMFVEEEDGGKGVLWWSSDVDYVVCAQGVDFVSGRC